MSAFDPKRTYIPLSLSLTNVWSRDRPAQFGNAASMTDNIDENSRLSGWVRLWIVFTAMSWLFGGLDIAFSVETLQWPPPIGELTPQSARHLVWLFAPILLAVAWISVRWIWRGFQPPIAQAATPTMSTPELFSRTLSLLARFVFFLIGLIAIAFLAYVTFMTTEAMDASDMSDTWWGGILVTFHLCFMLCMMWNIWQWITESPTD